jgi:nucleotide-binding universal stress UspA family protein
MNAAGERRPIQRILVALDASSHSLAGLEAAVALAASHRAEILGIYVEDINLLRLAEMPFASEFGQFSARRRKLDTGGLESQLRTRAERARLALIQRAETAGLTWAFRVVRGSIPEELIAATQETDLIILGQRGWSNFSQVGSTTQTIVTQARRLTLILREGIRLGQSVLAVYDGTAGAEEALRQAGALAQDRDGKLIVLLIAPDQEGALQLQVNVAIWGEGISVPLTFHWLSRTDARIVCSIAQTEGIGIFIVPRESSALTEATLLAILVEINCPVMIVHRPESEEEEPLA